jgi:ATP-dependent HslUV protease subunit HslV
VKSIHGTTILGVRKDGIVAMGSDGQVTVGDTIMKANAKKIQSLREGKVLAGFAGSVADALTLFTMFEEQINRYPKNISKAVIEFAKQWRKDKYLRRLEALLGVMSLDESFILSGSGEVIRPDDGLIGIGSGGGYAICAARALLLHSSLDAPEIVKTSIKLASDICVYTNDYISVEVIKSGK